VVACGTDKRNLLVLPHGRPPDRLDRPESEVSPMRLRRRDTPAARRQPPESGGRRQRPEPGGWQRPAQPDGWRQPPETTAEPVPLRRPYIPPDAFPPQDLTPPPPSRFRPRRQPTAQVQAPAGAASPPPARPQPAMRRWRPMRAILGDELRTPILWCEFGSCIARYTSEDARGEHDLRGRALAVGWRYDGLGRLACPACTRHDPSFWASRPPARADQEPPSRWSPRPYRRA
jgi:hypothetical protein